MYYTNYNPFFMPNRNYNYQRNAYIHNIAEINKSSNIQKKNTVPSNDDTISFQNFYPNNDSNSSEKHEEPTLKNNHKSRLFSFDCDKISILGFDLEIDDLIILAIIILLLRDYNENYALIIILGLILLNVNLSDVFNLF
ncbi:MAG: hypothetical protein J6A15_09100 [Clostridia bacterium]|nr:hypothetical protein [Clostridia bacterium]